MAQPTPETLLISAILNTQDAFAGRTYGVNPKHFLGYRDQYEWVLDHDEHYGSCPTYTEFITKFPDFPYEGKQFDARYPADEIKRQASVRDLLLRMVKTGRLITQQKIEEAFEEIGGAHLDVTSEKPVNLLVDPGYLDDYAEIPHRRDRVPMPWNTLHGKTNGIGPGELWYFAARQGHGKSSFLIDMAVSAARQGLTTCIYSLEMPKRNVQVRAHVSCGYRLGLPVNGYEMLHGTFDQLKYKKLLDAISLEFPGAIHIHDASMGRVSPGVIAARANEYDVSIVDYVGLMYTDAGVPAISDYRAMAEISNQLKEVALAKRTRVIGAAQVNREGATKRRPPKLAHLAQSDHLGNDGDVVVTMMRWGRDACALSLEKNRNGDSGRLFYTKYDPNHGCYEEIDRLEADVLKMENGFDDD